MKIRGIKNINYIQFFFLMSATICFFVALLLIRGISNQIQYWQEDAKNTAQQAAANVARKIDDKLSMVAFVADKLADDLTNGQLTVAELTKRFEYDVSLHPNLIDLGVAFTPYGSSRDVRLHAPYIKNLDGNTTVYKLDYDFTKPGNDWFHVAAAKGSNWVGPIKSKIHDKQLIIRYSKTFYRGNKFFGVVFVSFAMENLHHIIESLNIGKTGYGFILSKTGRFIAHPNEDFVEKRRTIFDLAGDPDNHYVLPKILDAVYGKKEIVDIENKSTGKSTWISFEPIKSNGWSAGIVFIKSEGDFDEDLSRRNKIWISLAIMIGMICLSCTILGVHKGGVARLYRTMFVGSLIIVLEIGFLWQLTLSSPFKISNKNVVIVDNAGWNKFFKKWHEGSPKYGNSKGPILVPTGIHIKSIELKTANNIKLSGLIWQSHNQNINKRLEYGFYFKDAVSIEKGSPVEIYKKINEDGVETGGFFWTVLREKFDYSRYPFDKKNILIRLRYSEFGRNVMLVPDLKAYQHINPSSLPGIEKDLVLPGWQLKRSFYSYIKEDINWSGIKNDEIDDFIPEMRFNVIIQRHFIGPFIANILPIIVILSILFSLLMIVTKTDRKLVAFGYNVNAVLGVSAALFFSVMLSHIHLRESLAFEGIVYLEYFFFVLYLAILLVAANSFLFNSDSKLFFIKFRDNLLPKLLYWPLLLGSILVITLRFFY